MGHIKEPKGIDFIIKSKPLTNDEKAAISEFIRQYKAKHFAKKVSRKTRRSEVRKKTST
jgi:hypothetical protein